MEAVVTQEYGGDQDLDNLAQSTLAEESCNEFWARHVGSLGWVPPGSGASAAGNQGLPTPTVSPGLLETSWERAPC